MKIAILSDITYRASLPDDPKALGYYGSEQYHAVLAKALLDRGHDVHFFAPSGSTEIGTFYPLTLKFGDSTLHDSLNDVSLDNLDYKLLLDMDFIIDVSANCRNIEHLNHYHGYKNYCCYRNGYAAWAVPRVPRIDRHYVVPSKQNQELFAQSGFDSKVVYYGIPEFYCPGKEDKYFNIFVQNYGLLDKNFYIFPHRPTPEKGTEIILRLAKDFPQETFVFAGHTPIPEHMMARTELQKNVQRLQIPNIQFVDIPLNPQHHYYKRELYRRAKAVLSPFIYPMYKEGFGLSNAEAVACGTPLIITDSPSTRELWMDGKDALFCDGYKSFKLYVEHFASYPLTPDNKFSVEEYAKGYEDYIAASALYMT